MPIVLSFILSLLGLFLLQTLLGLRRVARNVGSVYFRPQNDHLINLGVNFGSNLSGPYFLFSLESLPGQLIARIVRPIPYLNMGTTWMLSKKHQGTGA